MVNMEHDQRLTSPTYMHERHTVLSHENIERLEWTDNDGAVASIPVYSWLRHCLRCRAECWRECRQSTVIIYGKCTTIFLQIAVRSPFPARVDFRLPRQDDAHSLHPLQVLRHALLRENARDGDRRCLGVRGRELYR
jgi:hypothetical protein